MKDRLFAVLSVLLAIAFASHVSGCEEDERCPNGFKPFNCNEVTPSMGTLHVKVIISGSNPFIPVTIFRGTVEQNQIELQDTLTSVSKDYYLPNAEYSVRATYQTTINGNPATVYSIDGGTLRYNSTEYCDGKCYEEGRLDLDAEFP